MKKRIGVLLSGRGSNFEALADSVAAGRIPDAEIAIVISNREDAPGLQSAGERGIPAQAIPSKGLEREAYDRLVVAALQASTSIWFASRDSCGCSRRISWRRFRIAF